MSTTLPNIPQVDFYILPDGQAEARYHFAARITDKAYRNGHRIFLSTQSTEQNRYMDDILWTFNDRSFVPHSLLASENTESNDNAAWIGDADPPEWLNDVLINLRDSIAPKFESFQRIVEIIDASDESKKSGRQRFRYYREQGIEPNTHKI